MAFNPFGVFRRNQKTLFVVLTVFVMFVFTLQFGPGDFFQSIPRWIGRNRSSGDVMAVVDGTKLYSSQLDQQRRGRILANEFMARAHATATNNMAEAVNKGVATAGPAVKPAVQELLQGLQFLALSQQNPQFGQIGQRAINGAQLQLKAAIDNSGTPKDDLELARTAEGLLKFMGRGQAVEQFGYFFNQPMRTNKDAFEFALWLKKADKLGIGLAGEDTFGLVRREMRDKISAADFKKFEADVLDKRSGQDGFSKDRLHEALAAEFRVRAAMNVVLGPGAVTTDGAGSQVVNAPYEAFEFFKKQSAGATYGVIAVPVENYLDKVTGTPTQAELTEIFNKARNDEPDPARERPGMKEPRKLKFEYLEATGSEAYYKLAAEDGFKKAELHAKTAGFVVAPLGLAAWSVVAAVPVVGLPEPALTKQYDDFKKDFEGAVRVGWIDSSPLGTPLRTTMNMPTTVAAAVATSAGSLLTFGGPLTAAVLYEQRAKIDERNDKARVMAALLVPPALTDATIIGRAAEAVARLPQPPALAVVRGEFAIKAKADLGRFLADTDLRTFQDELAKLGAKKDKADARAYLEKFVKEKGFVLGGSKEFRDQYAVGDDAGLAVLKAKMEKTLPVDGPPRQFGREFFFEFDPTTRRVVPAKAFYAPQAYLGSMDLREGETNYLVWRTEEVPADAPKTLLAAQLKAEAAWRRAKARELAKAAADELAKATGGFGPTPGAVSQKLRDLHTEYQNKFADAAAKARAKYFLLSNVCPLPLPAGNRMFAAARDEYQPYSILGKKDIPYPTPQLESELLKNKDKPISTTLVLPDAGKNEFYVAVLADRNEPTTDEFYNKVYTGFDRLPQVLGESHQTEELMKAREQAVALLKAEFRVEKENAEKLTEKGDGAGE